MILFRADGNSAIGQGHIMRCLSIAEAARDRGIESVFVVASDHPEFLIRPRGFEAVVTGGAYDSLEGEDLSELLDKYQPSVLILDSYFVTPAYMEELRDSCQQRGCRLVYIDDLLSFPYPCDILINYEIYADIEAYEELYRGGSTPEIMLGTDYVPLRKEFSFFHERAVREEAENILVSTGGGDPCHLALRLMERVGDYPYKYHFIISSLNQDREALCDMAAKKSNVVLRENVGDMAGLLACCDLAISAGGSTLYELCAMQVPTVTYILADNQIELANTFHKRGIIECCGDIRTDPKGCLADEILRAAEDLAQNVLRRRQIAEKMASIVDGRGAERIVDCLLGMKK